MLIHVGYHKTASTALQEHVFRKPESGFACWSDDRKRVHPYLVCQSPLAQVPIAARSELAALESEARAQGKCFVVSHERLSGYYATGGFDSEAIARRLATAFPEARILIVVREQTSMLGSFYSQYVSDGGVLPFKKFMRPVSQSLRRAPEFDFDYLCYDRLVGLYQNLFGSDRVLVLPFEMLNTDPAEFIGRIGEHAGVAIATKDYSDGLPRTNDRRSFLLQSAIRQVNRLQRSQLNPGGLIESLPIHAAANWLSQHVSPAIDALTPEFVSRSIANGRKRSIVRMVAGRYAESNAHLGTLTGLDLSKWGYELPD